jgi:hypothetical protein
MEFGRQEALEIDVPSEDDAVGVRDALKDLERLEGKIVGEVLTSEKSDDPVGHKSPAAKSR